MRVILCAVICCLFQNLCSAQDCFDPVSEVPLLDQRGSTFTGTLSLSDKYITSTWYKSTGTNGRYQMVDNSTKPGPNKCGTSYPIYLNESHPNYDDITSEPISKKACLMTFRDPCLYTYDIDIRKCGDELQYNLKSTTEHSAYCFDLETEAADLTAAPTNAIPTTIEVKATLVYITAENNYKLPELRFKCWYNDDGFNYYYYSYWFINGNYISKLKREATIPLSEQDILDIGFRLGITLRCGIRVASSQNNAFTDMKESNDFFAGLKLNKHSVMIKKGEEDTIEFEQTVPLGCAHTSSDIDCYHTLLMVDANQTSATHTCDQSIPAVQSLHEYCGVRIKGELIDTDNNWQGQKYKMKIKTTNGNYNNDVFTLEMKMDKVGREHLIWQDYTVDYVTTTVIDDNNWHYKECKSVVDPHMTTGDGKTYENQEQEGVFILYRNTLYQTEVHERIKRCAHHNALCTCAISVRAGADIFTVNLCTNKTVIDFLACGENILQVLYFEKQNKYQITTPIGTVIQIQLKPHNNSKYKDNINTEIFLTPKDITNVDGLCGYFDDNKTNDFKLSTGSFLNINKDEDRKIFINSWMFGGKYLNKSEDESYLVPPKINPTYMNSTNMYCVCNNSAPNKTDLNEATCSKSEYQLCKRKTIPNNGRAKLCKISSKKRSVSSHYKELVRKLEYQFSVDSPIRKRSEYSPPTMTYTQEAFDKCYSSVMNSFLATDDRMSQSALNASVRSCAFDVTQTGDQGFIQVHIDVNNNEMNFFNNLDVLYSTANPEKIIEFKNQACLGNCYGHGTCNLEVCQCNNGYRGADCSIDITDKIHVDDIEYGGFCDLAEIDECRCFEVQSYNVDEKFVCNINTRKIMIDNTSTSDSFQVQGEFADLFTGICCVHESRKKRSSNEVFVTEHEITISNDGIHFGNGHTVYIFDSVCQNFTDIDGNITFILKTGYCFIDGVCVEESAFGEECKTCSSRSNLFEWTTTRDCGEPKTETGDSTDIVLIAALVGSLTVILVTGAVVFGLKYSSYKRRSAEYNVYNVFDMNIRKT